MLVAAPRPPQPPAPLGGATWRYVDRARTHDLLAVWSERRGELRVVETAPAAPDALVEEVVKVARPWEARVARWLLDARLAQLGEYWRSRAGEAGWTRVGRPVGSPTPDPRRNEVVGAAHAPFVHHYHDEHGGGDRLLAALRAVGERYVVVRAAVDVPHLDIGRIDVVHAQLPDVLTRSVVLREEIALTQTGMGKLVTRDDYQRAFGHGSERRAARLVDEVLHRVREGALDRPTERVADADEYAEFLETLSDPRLLALHSRFLYPGEEEELLEAGPIEILKSIQAKRTQAAHTEQHLLTILEAALLARERMRGGRLRRGDPEMRALTRLAYYL